MKKFNGLKILCYYSIFIRKILSSKHLLCFSHFRYVKLFFFQEKNSQFVCKPNLNYCQYVSTLSYSFYEVDVSCFSWAFILFSPRQF